MRKKLALLGAIFGAGAVLYSCGGGGGGTTGTTAALYLTDAPGNDYQAFEVTIYEVNLCVDSTCQTKENIFQDPAGVTVDLKNLNGKLQYMNTSSLSSTTYAGFEVVVGDTANVCTSLNPLTCNDAIFQSGTYNNNTNTVNCDPNTGQCSITYSGTVNVGSQVVIDFNLQGFNVNENTTPWQIDAVEVIAPTQTPPPTVPYEFYAIVQSQNGNTLQVQWRGYTYTVVINDYTHCEDINDTEGNGPTYCLSVIQQGACVGIETQPGVDPASTTTVTAKEVEVKERYKCGMAYAEYYGTVQSVNTDTDPYTFTITTNNNASVDITVTNFTKCEYEYYMDGEEIEYEAYGNKCIVAPDDTQVLQNGWCVEVKVNENNEAIKIEYEQGDSEYCQS